MQLFYARSKLIIVLTDGGFEIAEAQKVKQYLNPFLKRKILLLKPKGDMDFGENIKKLEWEI